MTATIVETYVWDGIPVRIFSDSCPKFWWSVWPDGDPGDYPAQAGISSRWDPARSLAAARRGARRRVRHEPKRQTPPRTFGFLFFSLAVCCVGTAVNGTFLAWWPGAWTFRVDLGICSLCAVFNAFMLRDRRRRWMASRRTEWQAQQANSGTVTITSSAGTFSVPSYMVGVARPETPLEDLKRVDHALTGWKRAALSFDGGAVKFCAATNGSTYGAVATAECRGYVSIGVGVPHVVAGPRAMGYDIPDPNFAPPNRNCTCGFYAVRDRGMLPQLAGEYGSTVCDLEVELSGHYLQYKHGFRAERQQVVSVRVDRRCRSCGTYPLDAEVLVAARGLLVPMCEPCAKSDGERRFTLAELAAELGVHDVRWADRPALQKGT